MLKRYRALDAGVGAPCEKLRTGLPPELFRAAGILSVPALTDNSLSSWEPLIKGGAILVFRRPKPLSPTIPQGPNSF